MSVQTLKDRRVVVTGSARGLGLAMAKACCKAGASVILADLLVEQGQAEAKHLREDGYDASFFPLDLAEPDAIDAFCAAVQASHGTVDGLVNNAAIATNVGGIGFEAIDMDLWDRVQRVNVRGLWLMMRGMSPLLSGTARVVNLASDTALWGAPNLLAYTASKGAVIAMTRSLARELGPRGIGVTAIAPGIIRCEATDYVPAARHQLYETQRAVPGPQFPEDIVDVVTFLLTIGALPLTGQILPVDAGFVFN